MSDFFDIYNLMILALAVAIFLRLRSVLGRRTGNERPPYDPYAARSGQDNSRENVRDNVVSLPRPSGAERTPGAAPEDAQERIEPHARKGTPLFDSLHAIMSADPAFDPKSFVQGAGMAYEMIVTAFANGDRDTLQPLLSPEVFEGFDAAIAARNEAGQTMSTTLIGIDKVAISDAALRADTARVTVRVESQMITATYDRSGELVDGDPNKVVDVVDIWTFERPVPSDDPNWVLVATEAA
jgi:predicted lipid-binding transport protein (Tim44 family)